MTDEQFKEFMFVMREILKATKDNKPGFYHCSNCCDDY